VDQFGANRMIWHLDWKRSLCLSSGAAEIGGARAARAGVIRRIDELANLRHLVIEAAMRHLADSDD
jgi:hypothetical protein